MSWMTQLKSLITRPKATAKVVNSVAEQLAWLTRRGALVHIHFIPSHTEQEGEIVTGIGRSIEIDNLAKEAATLDDLDVHPYRPRVQSYRAIFRKLEKTKLEKKLTRKITPSH